MPGELLGKRNLCRFRMATGIQAAAAPWTADTPPGPVRHAVPSSLLASQSPTQPLDPQAGTRPQPSASPHAPTHSVPFLLFGSTSKQPTASPFLPSLPFSLTQRL